MNSTNNRKWIDAQLDDALQEIFCFSLAKRGTDRNSITIHPLMHAWTREWLDWQHQTTLARESIHLLGAKLVDPIHERQISREHSSSFCSLC